MRREHELEVTRVNIFTPKGALQALVGCLACVAAYDRQICAAAFSYAGGVCGFSSMVISFDTDRPGACGIVGFTWHLAPGADRHEHRWTRN